MAVVKSLFGWMIGVLIIILIFPFAFVVWLITLPFDKERKIIHWILIYHAVILAKCIPFVKIRVEGRSKVDSKGPYVIIANHQSTLDILAVNCIRQNFKWVSKDSNLKVPILGWYLRMADYIIIVRGDPTSRDKLYAKANDFLQRGISVMMFPEGTRSVDGNMQMFKRGAFKLAIDNNVPILPVLLEGTGAVLPKKGFVIKETKEIQVKILDPVYPLDFGTDDHDVLAQKFHDMMAVEYEKLLKRT